MQERSEDEDALYYGFIFSSKCESYKLPLNKQATYECDLPDIILSYQQPLSNLGKSENDKEQ